MDEKLVLISIIRKISILDLHKKYYVSSSRRLIYDCTIMMFPQMSFGLKVLRAELSLSVMWMTGCQEGDARHWTFHLDGRPPPVGLPWTVDTLIQILKQGV